MKCCVRKEVLKIDEHTARWIEIEFYIIISDLFFLQQQFNDVATFLRAVALFGDYDADKSIELAKTTLCIDNIRPSKIEFTVMATLNSMSTQWTAQKLNICPSRIPEMVKQHKKNPVLIRPRLNEEQLELAHKVNDAFHNLQRVGVPYHAKSTNSMELIQELRSGRSGDESLRLV